MMLNGGAVAVGLLAILLAVIGVMIWNVVT